MKRWIILLLSLALVLGLAACDQGTPPAPSGDASTPAGDPQPSGESQAASQPAQGQEAFVFTHKGVDIRLHGDMAPILEALGEPISYTESASCAFTGLDKTYNYGSFCITTYPQGDQDRVFNFWFTDDSVTTSQGLYIGAAQSEAESACGAQSFNGLNAYVVNVGDTRMTVIITDGVISSIQYTVVLA